MTPPLRTETAAPDGAPTAGARTKDRAFEIALVKSETIKATIVADTPDEALRLARAQNPDYRDIGEVLDMKDGECVEEHVLAGECEWCGKMIWDEHDLVHGDDITLCVKCFNTKHT